MDVNRGDAESGQRDGQRWASCRHASNRDRLNWVLTLGGGRSHLVEMCGAGEGLTVDRGHFAGVRTIDSDEDDAPGSGAILAGVNDHVLHARGGGLKRSVSEVRANPIEAAECAEARQGIRIGAVRWPEVRCKNSLGSEDS